MTAATLTLTDFLLARIGEDERAARVEVGRRDVILTGAFAPARILAECESKRRIVEWITDDEPGWEAGPDYWAGLAVAQEALRLLALPFADHPDYRDEWRP